MITPSDFTTTIFFRIILDGGIMLINGEPTALERGDSVIWEERSGTILALRGAAPLHWSTRDNKIIFCKSAVEFHKFMVVLLDLMKFEKTVNYYDGRIVYEIK